jgi:hypothetical protein
MDALLYMSDSEGRKGEKVMAKGDRESDPRYHARNIQQMLSDLIQHVREDVSKVREPRFQALLETSAEVLSGLRTAYEHYEKKSEAAFA